MSGFKIINENHVQINGNNYRKIDVHEIIANRYHMMRLEAHYFNLGVDPKSFERLVAPLRTFTETPATDMTAHEVHGLKNEMVLLLHKWQERASLAFSNYDRPLNIACMMWLRDGEAQEYDGVYNTNVKLPEMKSSNESVNFFLTVGVQYLMSTKSLSPTDLEQIHLLAELLRISMTADILQD